MKTKTISKVIRAKMNEWFETIDNEEVKELAKKNTIVTGGAIASMLLKEKVNDFDVYFRDYETTRAVVNYYVNRFNPKAASGIPCQIYVEDVNDRIRIVIKSAGIASEEGTDTAYEYFENRPAADAGNYVSEILGDPGEIQDTYDETEDMALQIEDDGPKYRPVFMSTNAITLSHKIQIVNRFYGKPDEIHENYDFVHCTNYWTSWNDELVLRKDALEALLTRELRYVGSKYPVCSIIRLRKFIKRGWHINAGQILKIVMQISELDLTKPEVLEDQLTGVDAAYFMQLMHKVKEKDPEKINSAYLVEVIDRIF